MRRNPSVHQTETDDTKVETCGPVWKKVLRVHEPQTSNQASSVQVSFFCITPSPRRPAPTPSPWRPADPPVLLLEAQGEVDPVDDADDDGLPGNQVSEPVEQLAVEDVRLLPAGGTRAS